MTEGRSLEIVEKAVFSINGTVHKVGSEIDVSTTLNSYLRNTLGLTGTKVMCGEGSCGACVVTMKITDPISNKERSMPVNSCLIPVLACHGTSITTVEGIGSRQDGYNKVQTTLAHFNGSQCGFCSPGFVMTIYSLLSSNPNLTMEEAEESLSGNICRCTGYRPILDAFKSLTSNPPIQLKQKLLDIEDSHILCPKRGSCRKLSESESCSNCFHTRDNDLSLDYPEIALASEKIKINDGMREWYRVSSVKEIMEVFDKIENKSYTLVAGNTSKGVTVLRRSRIEIDPQVYIDIGGIAELKETSITNNYFVIGSGVTVSMLMEELKKLAANFRHTFSYANEIAHHLKLVANVPVANMATVGGNLYFSHEHPDFPSDIVLLFQAVSAQITIECNSGIVESISLDEFMLKDMTKKVIISISIPSMPLGYKLKSYKVMQSAQNSPAIVNAAFLYNVALHKPCSDIIEFRPTLIFGGIKKKFVRAVKTELFLTGKMICQKGVLKESLKILETEIDPDELPVNFSMSYRKLLALTLFYRSVLSLIPCKEKGRLTSGVDPIERLISKGKQVYYTDEKEWPLTQPMPKLEAQIQCSGEAKFTKDIHEQGELFAKFIIANCIGEIGDINATNALALKGVKGFYTAKDIVGINNLLYPTKMGEFAPMELLCSGNATYCGQPVGIIVAKDEETAVRAARLVTISYKSEKHTILSTIQDVLSSKEQDRITKRDSFEPAKKPETPKYKFSGQVELGGQYSHAMETQSAIVCPEENGQLRIRSATQAITYTLGAINQITGVPMSKMECSVTRVGGAYGSKVVSQLWIAAGAALAAVKLNKPVRMSFTASEEMTIIGKRTPTLIKYEGGIDENGKLQGLDIHAYYDFGSQISAIYSTIVPYLKYIVPNCYDYSTWSFTSYTVKTDNPPASILRSPCFNPLYSLTEQIMDHAAFTAKLDPINVRLVNAGDEHIYKHITDWRQSTEYDTRKADIDQFNKENRWKKKGLSLTAMKYPFDYYYRNIGCSVSILWPDGTVQIVHGAIEMGQGINTKISLVVAHELGVDLKNVNVLSATSKVTPNNHESVASVSGELACYAALKCCQDLNSRITPIKEKMQNPTWKDLVNKLHQSEINLNANYAGGIPRKESELSNYNVYGVAVTETEIDCLTGERKISRVDILEDVGKSLSPELDVGQVEGAYIMGLGLVTGERIVFDEMTGAILNNTLWNYKAPTSKDIPEDFRITFVPNSTNPASVLGSKAVGEPSLALSVGVVNSLRYALTAARKNSGVKPYGKTWLPLVCPCTTEQLLMKANTTRDNLTI